MRKYTLMVLITALLTVVSMNAQIVQNGYTVITCYSGGSPSGFVAGVVDVTNASTQPVNMHYPAPTNHGSGPNLFTRQNLGDVYGICFDANTNFYFAATTVYSGTSAGGPGGNGAIYKVNNITGMISVFVGTLNAACGSVVGTSQIPNTGPALGNIAYDAANDQFFATNFEDGMIYRISNTGIVLSTYDPFSPDGCTAGPAPLGERLWGIGVYNGRVYYSRWYEDCGAPSNIVANEIWSVQLNGSGDFVPTSNQLEISVPPLPGAFHSNPVADIEFSSAGRMLIGERTMTAIGNNPLFPNAHASRVLEYIFSGSSWNASTNIFSIGVPGPSSGCGSFPSVGANSAGGVDYAYGSFDAATREPVDCDSSIWATGDYLSGSPQLIYGMQLTPASGGLASGSVLYDFDGNTSSGQKTQIGDVDVYRNCGVQGDPCDQLQYKVSYLPPTPDNDDCCLKLEFTTTTPNLFSMIGVNILTPNVTITGAIGPYGWGVTNSGTAATWAPTSGNIPVGTVDSLIFCLFSLAPIPQMFEVVAYGTDGSICRDTLAADCKQQQPPKPLCFSMDSSKIECALINNGSYTYDYGLVITNNSPFSNAPFNLPAENVLVYPITGGVTIVPGALNFPPLGYGQQSGWLNFAISGPSVVPGATICFVMQLHGAKYQSDYQWCCPPDTICIRLPECEDCCDNFRFNIKSDKINPLANGIVNMNLSVTAGPSPIIHASATLVSVAHKSFGPGKCGNGNWIQGAGTINNASPSFNGLPMINYPAPFTNPPPAPYGSVDWGTVPNGVAISGANMQLQLQLPPPPSSQLCRDSLRFCVRYAFTDTNCVTCDTIVCYELVRRGKIIIDHWDHATGANIVQLKMSDLNTGVLSFDLPEVDAKDPDSEYEITGFEFEPEPGVELTGLKGADGNYAELADRVARYDGIMNQGNNYEFDLSLINPSAYTFRGRVKASWKVEEGEKLMSGTEEFTIQAIVPRADGGISDTLAEDLSTELLNVHTYALYFVNSNIDRLPIESITITLPDGVNLLAVGPTASSREVSLNVLKDTLAGLSLPGVTNATYSIDLLGPSERLKPIYLTVETASKDDITVSYTSRTRSGIKVSEAEFNLKSVTSIIDAKKGGDDALQALINTAVRPNPANQSAELSFDAVKTLANVFIDIVDINGRTVKTVENGSQLLEGNYHFFIDTSDLVSGMYYCRIITDDGVITKLIEVIR